MSGTVTDTANWTLNVSGSTAPATPLPGLPLAAGLTGTVTDVAGAVRFDVHDTATATWTVEPGVTVSAGSFELSDKLPATGVLVAPGVVDGTPWADVTGTVATGSSGATQVAGTGTAAFNLSSGAGLLKATQSATLTLASSPTQVVLSQTSLSGNLTLGSSAITGPVTGTGTVTVTPASGSPVTATASVTLTTSGTLVVNFPLDISLIDAVSAGTPGTVYWAAAAVTGFAVSGGTVNLPAGLSVTTATATTPTAPTPPTPPTGGSGTGGNPTGPANSTYQLSTAVANFLKSLAVPLASSTLSGVLGGTTLTVTLPAPTGLPFTLPAGIPTPTFGPTTVTIDTSANTLTLDASATAGSNDPVGATLHVVIGNASTTTLSSSNGVTATLTLTGVPFVAGTTLALTGSLSYRAGALSASLTGSLESDLPLGPAAVVKPGP